MSGLRDKRISGSPDGFPPDWFTAEDVDKAIKEFRKKFPRLKIDLTWNDCLLINSLIDEVFGEEE